MHQAILERRKEVHTEIRRRHNHDKLEHARKAGFPSENDSGDTLTPAQLELALAPLHAAVLERGLESCEAELEALQRLSEQCRSVGPWFSGGLVRVLAEYLNAQQTLRVGTAVRVMRVLSRLVVNNQRSEHCQQLQQLGLLKSLVFLLDFEELAVTALHLVANLCGDSFSLRDQFLRLGLAAQLMRQFDFFKQEVHALRIFTWTLSNLAKTDEQTRLPRKVYRILGYYAVSLVLHNDDHIALHAGFTLEFIGESQPGLDILLEQDMWVKNCLLAVQRGGSAASRVLIHLGRAASVSSDVCDRLLKGGVLGVVSSGLEAGTMSTRLQQLSGWLLGCLLYLGYKTVQMMLSSGLLFSLDNLLRRCSAQDVLKEFSFLVCDLCCKANVNQLERLLNLGWVLEYVQLGLESEEAELRKHALMALHSMAFSCKEHYSTTSSNYLLGLLESHPRVLAAVEGLGAVGEGEVGQLAGDWLERYLAPRERC